MGRKWRKKATGLSEVQRKASRKIGGVPLSSDGRKRKYGSGSCGVFVVAAGLILAASVTLAADPPTVPDEAKVALVKAIQERAEKLRQDPAAQFAKKYQVAVADLKSASDGKINAGPKKTLPPTKGRAAYSFLTAEAKAEMVKELEKKLAEADPVTLAAANPAGFAPELDNLSPGNAGRLRFSGDVVEVIDKTSAIVRLSCFVGGPKPEVRKVNVLVSGIDTSKFADGLQAPLKGIYYVPGNTKVGGQTLMQLVPVTLTPKDTATLMAEKKPPEKP